MTGRYTAEMHEEYRKEQAAKAQREREERAERTEKLAARNAWIADGGSESAFEREWPKLRDEARRKRVLSADEQAREAARQASLRTISNL